MEPKIIMAALDIPAVKRISITRKKWLVHAIAKIITFVTMAAPYNIMVVRDVLPNLPKEKIGFPVDSLRS